MIPDYGLIAEIMLFSEGFASAKPLSKKMTQLYKLSSEQLSQQKHYDFGMRGIKSVLVMAGNIKRSSPDLKEDLILIRAMRDSNIPKFIKEDLPLFNALVQDLFPGIQIEDSRNATLMEQLPHSIHAMKLKVEDTQVKKVLELFETFQVRFGVMLVGVTNSGKTNVYEILKHAMGFIAQNQVNFSFRLKRPVTRSSSWCTPISWTQSPLPWGNSTGKPTSSPKSGKMVWPVKSCVNAPWVKPLIKNGACLMVRWMLTGSKTWIQCWMIIWCCVLRMVSVSNCVLKCVCFSRCKTWPWPVPPLWVVVVWFTSLRMTLVGRHIFIVGWKIIFRRWFYKLGALGPYGGAFLWVVGNLLE